MIELLSMLGGGIFRLLPEVLKVWNAKADHAHELAMTQLQLQIDQARATQQIDLVHAQAAIAADTAQMAALSEALRAQGQPSGIAWVDALSSSVRPVLTYWWCLFLYTSAKVSGLWIALAAGNSFEQIVPLLVTEFDRMVIGSIFAFWFVDRSLRKL
jgi:hypothetical protein